MDDTPLFFIRCDSLLEDHCLGSDGYIYLQYDETDEPEVVTTRDYKDRYKTIRGIEYYVYEGKWLNIARLFARCFLPLTAPPQDSCWDQMKIINPKGNINYVWSAKWLHPFRKPTVTTNKASKDSITNQKYITKSGKYFQLRINKKHYCNNFKELSDALKARKELLGF